MNYDYMIEQRGKETADGKSVTTMKQCPDHDFLSSARVTGYYERDYDENFKRQQERRTSRHKRHKKQRAWSERLVDGFRSFVAFLFSNVGIVCLVVGYTITGAFIFSAIEGTHELTVINRRSNVSIIRNSTATTLWNLTSKENTFSEKKWKAKVDAILEKYQAEIVRAVKKDDYDGNDYREKIQKWGFAGAFLYSLTVITTIGYGNTCPKTLWGKAVTIVYAIFGMPLFLLYLSNIGDILAWSFKWTYARCCLCSVINSIKDFKFMKSLTHRYFLHTSLNDLPCCWFAGNGNRCRKKRNARRRVYPASNDRNSLRFEQQMVRVNNLRNGENASTNGSEEEDQADHDDDDDDDKYNPRNITVPLTLCLAIMVGYICGGAKLFSEWESWNFLDGSYFCFVSLSTIGFGDIVPGEKIYAGQNLQLSSIFCSMYLMLGMALIAMCFNLMQEEVVAKFRTLTRSIKHVLSCER